MPWYTGDFMTATRGWPVTAKGVYRELLDCQWDRGALPADPRELRQLIGATPSEWKWWEKLIELKFPAGADGQRRNARLEQHRQHALHVSQVRQEMGRRGAAAKKGRADNVRQFPGGAR